ncbi:carboxypeptidase M32 [Salinarimonas soli]|uniref:Metal-dependent carboxypeptidase n=1 Tax=Salinarimonas soli TaxID=1638099 RepID=A0A5B2VR41_9HYPH|nr:carboxypeptidase M32 [Salinarimonas soli]KAA2241060.1 carboxypeptidase M32 [Salinarimonas soli]
MTLRALRAEIAAVNDLLCASSVLVWDSRTMMPKGGAAARGHQIAALIEAARARLMGPATARALEGALREVESLPEDDAAVREVGAVRDALAFHARIPADLLRAKAELRAAANGAWIEARALSRFDLFEPYLTRTVALAREYAAAIGGGGHPYDALIGLYEPGETVASLETLFAALREGIRPLLERAAARPAPRLDVLRRSFPAERQRDFAAAIAARFGYDFDRGRLDFTVHPFEISFTRADVRLTLRRAETFDPPAIFGGFHEAGHGLYEQNVDEAYTRTALATDLVGFYAVGGTSFGAHESQSRLWENHVGRSPAFWARHFADLQAAFPDALGDIDADAFHAAITHVRPGAIRTDADELTYDLHIMLRVELEARLIAGEIEARDIPEAWNAAMRRDLGVAVASDAMGCLQDIHWSSGMIGSFCTYTIGNVMAAQLFVSAMGDPGVRDGLEAGDYAPLHHWLRERVWRHGRRFSRDELLVRATGRALDPAPYLAHLAARYGA